MKNFASCYRNRRKINFQKPKLPSISFKNISLCYGILGLKVNQETRVTPKQFEILRQLLVKYFTKKTKIWFFIFPHFCVSQKPKETRMGKGKGNILIWVVFLHKGLLLFELSYPYEINVSIKKEFLDIIRTKLTIPTRWLFFKNKYQ